MFSLKSQLEFMNWYLIKKISYFNRKLKNLKEKLQKLDKDYVENKHQINNEIKLTEKEIENFNKIKNDILKVLNYFNKGKE